MSNPSTNFGGICKILKRRYNAFWKGVITPFYFAVLRLLKRHYYAFLKGVITYAFPFCIITPFRKEL